MKKASNANSWESTALVRSTCEGEGEVRMRVGDEMWEKCVGEGAFEGVGVGVREGVDEGNNNGEGVEVRALVRWTFVRGSCTTSEPQPPGAEMMSKS